jgi:hypothetical protein
MVDLRVEARCDNHMNSPHFHGGTLLLPPDTSVRLRRGSMNELSKGSCRFFSLTGLELTTIVPASAFAIDKSWQLSSPAIQPARFHLHECPNRW